MMGTGCPTVLVIGHGILVEINNHGFRRKIFLKTLHAELSSHPARFYSAKGNLKCT